MTSQTDVALTGIHSTDARWREVLTDLTDEQVTGPSRLPDWTRGHVLAHVVGLGTAAARQLESAVAGEVVEFYPGGRPARDAAIEAGAGAAAAEHTAQVRATLERVEAALPRLTPEVLDRPTGYRDRPVSAVVLLWWREALIHLVDVDLGVGHMEAWDPPFRAHLAEYLAPRVPEGVRLEVRSWDGDEEYVLGTGTPLAVQGMANDVFAWLAGREPGGTVVAERGGDHVALPELGPWP